MTDKQCKELTLVVVFPYGKFGYTAKRDVQLSPVKYVNARLLHYSGRFATNPEYLLYAQFIIEQQKYLMVLILLLRRFMVKLLQHHY